MNALPYAARGDPGGQAFCFWLERTERKSSPFGLARLVFVHPQGRLMRCPLDFPGHPVRHRCPVKNRLQGFF